MSNLINSRLRLGVDRLGKPCYNEYIKTSGGAEMFDSSIIEEALSALQDAVNDQEAMDGDLQAKMDEIEEAKDALESAFSEVAGVLDMLANLDTSGLEDALDVARSLTD